MSEKVQDPSFYLMYSSVMGYDVTKRVDIAKNAESNGCEVIACYTNADIAKLKEHIRDEVLDEVRHFRAIRVERDSLREQVAMLQKLLEYSDNDSAEHLPCEQTIKGEQMSITRENSNPTQKYAVNEHVGIQGWAGEMQFGAVEQIEWIYHPRAERFCWGYKIKFDEGCLNPFSFVFIPEGYLRKLK